MDAIRQILSPSNGKLLIEIPEGYQQTRFEVIVLPIEDAQIKERIQEKMTAFLNTLPTDEPAITEEEIMAEIKAVRSERHGK